MKAAERSKGSRKGVDLEREKQKLQTEEKAAMWIRLDARPIEV
jgi:hypothetical protein